MARRMVIGNNFSVRRVMYPDVGGEECHRTVNGQLLETADDGAGDGGDLARVNAMPDSHLQSPSPQRHNISARCTFHEVACIPVELPLLFRFFGSKTKTSKKWNSGHGRGHAE